MTIDFTFPPEVDAVRLRVREFVSTVVSPAEAAQHAGATGDHRQDRRALVQMIMRLREQAREWDLWLPHMPPEWGGMGLGPTAMAAVSAEAARASLGPFVLNCQAPDEGNQHTLLHWGTPDQKEKYLRPLCDGTARSCFAMTEPEVAGSDPTLIQTRAEPDGDEWVVNGHKWFISGARRAGFAILIARTEDDPDLPQAANTAFIVDLPCEGVGDRPRHRDHGRKPQPLRDPHHRSAGVQRTTCSAARGQGHLLGQARLGPARLAHCMRWIAQCETALDMMVDRALNRYAHGSLLAEKQGIQWLIADSTMELYQAKLMVLHAAYRIENDLPFKTEVSMAKHFVANTLWRIVDRAVQVHGALGYSTDTPLADMLKQARWSRFADGADEVHQMTIARNAISAYRDHGSTRAATGDLPL